MFKHHLCDDQCRRRGLVDAHTRARREHRERVARKFKGHRIRVRPVHADGAS